ncbi:MAG: DUF6179 domain-containing protein [Oscillospiraceae bacterium]|nr:DUF6179 domain-containing protein [Oscillospiraceae bacterium]
MTKTAGGNDSKIPKSLSETHKIKAENIDASAYFLSLTANALEAGILTDKDMAEIQTQVYSILSDNIAMYTKGKSASVSSQEANRLMASVLRALDCFCISVTGPNLSAASEQKLEELANLFTQKAGIKKCYEKGLAFLGQASAKDIAISEISSEIDNMLMHAFENLFDAEEYARFEKEQNERKKILAESAMTDVAFNALCLKLEKCKTAGQKAELIIDSVSSAADFLDILNSQCLFGDDYLVLYETLAKNSMETIEFLLSSAPANEEEWHNYLIEFIYKAKGEFYHENKN